MQRQQLSLPMPPSQAETLHRSLAHWNHRRLRPQCPRNDWAQELDEEREMRGLEARWIEAFRSTIAKRAATAPRDLYGFESWFRALEAEGPGQHDPLFD